MDINALKELVSKYTYGRLNILDGNLAIGYVPNKGLILENFYDYDPKNNYGTCAELTLKSFSDIKRVFPEIYVTRVLGKDDTFFTSKGANHCYLLLSQKSLFDTKQSNILRLDDTNKDQIMQQIDEQKAILFDACFRKVEEFSKTNYAIDELLSEEFEEVMGTTEILTGKNSKPLIYNHNTKTLLGMQYDERFQSKIGLILKDEKGIRSYNDITIVQKYFNDYNKEHNIQDNKISRIINIIADTPKHPACLKEDSSKYYLQHHTPIGQKIQRIRYGF